MARLKNPYRNAGGRWMRGSFHGHCDENSACASVPLDQSVQWYSDVGAGFVTLTDHDFITDLAPVQARYPDLAFVPGFEYSSRENVVFAGPGVGPLYELPLEQALARAGDLFTMVCHPWPKAGRRDYWTLEKIEALGTLPDGLEVYNGHYGHAGARAAGRQPLYDVFWDQLLTAGHRLWGFANDDFHAPEDFDNAFNMVLAEENTAAASKHSVYGCERDWTHPERCVRDEVWEGSGGARMAARRRAVGSRRSCGARYWNCAGRRAITAGCMARRSSESSG